MNELFIGRSLALLIWNTEKEDDAHVYLGELQQQGDAICFINKEKGWSMRLDPGMLEKIKEVPETLKAVFLDAELTITVYMSDLPDDQKAGLLATGINWGG